METQTIAEAARQTPVRWHADVVVCGGGPAGCAAAISAARAGARTILLERYGYLGGLATGGLVLALPSFRDSGRPVIGGIGAELRQRMLDTGEAAFRRNEGDAVLFDPEALKWHSMDACRGAGVELLHHVWIAGAAAQDGHLSGVLVETKVGRLAVTGRVFVDATGDGDVLAAAGASYEVSEQHIGLPFRLINVDRDAWVQAGKDDADLGARIREIFREAGFGGWAGMTPMATDDGAVWCNNMVHEADALDPESLTRTEILARDAIRSAVAGLRAQIPGFENAWLIDTASQLGVRRSRRLQGEYVLSEEDVSQFDTRFEDAIGRGNDFRKQGIVYDIPFRSLVPKELDNLLVAGRCVSSTHDALEPLREIHVCWVMGEAAGLAAALAVRDETSVKAVDLPELQAALRDAGAVLADAETEDQP